MDIVSILQEALQYIVGVYELVHLQRHILYKIRVHVQQVLHRMQLYTQKRYGCDAGKYHQSFVSIG